MQTGHVVSRFRDRELHNTDATRSMCDGLRTLREPYMWGIGDAACLQCLQPSSAGSH
jgi:hypothetical protein